MAYEKINLEESIWLVLPQELGYCALPSDLYRSNTRLRVIYIHFLFYIKLNKALAILSYPSFISHPETTPRTNWILKTKLNSQPASNKHKA